MTRLHAVIQLIAPRGHGPVGEVARETMSAEECAQCIVEHIRAAASDGTIENGGCLIVTIQREAPRPPV